MHGVCFSVLVSSLSHAALVVQLAMGKLVDMAVVAVGVICVFFDTVVVLYVSFNSTTVN